MTKKVIALGNRLLRDDGIGIYVVENLEKEITKLGFEVFYGETDLNYCLNIINNNDFVLFVDAISLGQDAGQVTCLPLSEIKNLENSQFQHDLSIFSLLDLYNINIDGSLIGIEVSKIEMGLGLSSILDKQFAQICRDVYQEMVKSYKKI